MGKIVYTLKVKRNTQEMHLFEATTNPDDTCTPRSKSICKKMASSEGIENKFACCSEKDARKKMAEIGRDVCGICVSNLYATY